MHSSYHGPSLPVILTGVVLCPAAAARLALQLPEQEPVVHPAKHFTKSLILSKIYRFEICSKGKLL